ncbi:BRO-N domain-containing protein [Xenorhabdus eapokensis]|uniref:Antirepressor protein n=1 Tax=Xenorhabdus eapokensis TaxID=1873482 RepID=A0A1Q5TMN1_9GAMM|nr:antirepressor protein [Xenorhabdus eapokensis]
MTNLSVTAFMFENQPVRTLTKNGNTWFVAQDICDALKIKNSRDAIAKLDDDEKGVALTDTLSGKQKVNIINESGMYFLVIRCRDAVRRGTLPHRFRKWVTSEVLPAIRKTGSYISKKNTASLEKAIICPYCEKPANIVGVKYYHRERSEVLALCSNSQCPSQPFKFELSFCHYLHVENDNSPLIQQNIWGH